MERFRHDDPEHLDELCGRALTATRDRDRRRELDDRQRIPDLREFARLAREYDAQLYVDDAHGSACRRALARRALRVGLRGNGVIRHHGQTYENVIFVAGFSKAYPRSSPSWRCRRV